MIAKFVSVSGRKAPSFQARIQDIAFIEALSYSLSFRSWNVMETKAGGLTVHIGCRYFIEPLDIMENRWVPSTVPTNRLSGHEVHFVKGNTPSAPSLGSSANALNGAVFWLEVIDFVR
jgi:hypothetical protein